MAVCGTTAFLPKYLLMILYLFLCTLLIRFLFSTLKKPHREIDFFFSFNCEMKKKKLFALRIDIMRLILSISSKYFRYHHFALHSIICKAKAKNKHNFLNRYFLLCFFLLNSIHLIKKNSSYFFFHVNIKH